ncbi:biotin--[acetyl-CoA-carboxylase] ligase [Luteipulveratus sp. YIM 133132]|uniref:biotin--[acetyl-CoA-carboxylase] ligase n=1 Tax=Luteipulveratus flavus TaxID=3031728 RepID=UPI0023AF4A27|nr:biotin--[acetyl-CoA-carboxylase] ligase [Luteipulveratus sp. YIM 133132]MDE9367009.1 biotin--[acetyl-CoA-carboxylase] ligase [Luteipulveratus sp. YIM 133132]
MSRIGDAVTGPRRALMRDRIRAGLAAGPWSDLVVLDTVGSTNADLLRDPRPWRVVTADHQEQGRGRLARVWQAPPRSSIALSASLPLPADTSTWGWVPLLVGGVVRSTVRRAAGVDVGLKWPNDVLARSGSDAAWRKISGILCQTATHAGAPVVVVGVGLNVDQTVAELPVDTATSLRACGAGDLAREELVVDLLSGLATLQQSWADPTRLAELCAAYVAHCVTLGQVVDVHLPGDQVRRGRATSLDDDGRLVVTGPDGVVAHAVGDIVHVRATSGATDGGGR